MSLTHGQSGNGSPKKTKAALYRLRSHALETIHSIIYIRTVRIHMAIPISILPFNYLTEIKDPPVVFAICEQRPGNVDNLVERDSLHYHDHFHHIRV